MNMSSPELTKAKNHFAELKLRMSTTLKRFPPWLGPVALMSLLPLVKRLPRHTKYALWLALSTWYTDTRLKMFRDSTHTGQQHKQYRNAVNAHGIIDPVAQPLNAFDKLKRR